MLNDGIKTQVPGPEDSDRLPGLVYDQAEKKAGENRSIWCIGPGQEGIHRDWEKREVDSFKLNPEG